MIKKILPAILLIVLFGCNANDKPQEETISSQDNAIEQIRDSIKLFPENPVLKYNLAVVLQDAGMYKEALAAIDSMNVSLDNVKNPYIYYNYLDKKSELLELNADTLQAISTLEQLVAPGEISQASLRLANLYASTGNKHTVGLCDAMIKYDTIGAPEPYYFKAIYFDETGESQKAIALLDSSIKKKYTFLDAHLEKGSIYYEQKNYTDAVKAFDLAITISNQFADAYFWKGKCQEALGQKDEAKLNYQRAYGLDNTLTEAKEAAEKL